MASLATDARPAITGALLLTLALWLDCVAGPVATRAAFVPISDAVIEPLSILPVPPGTMADVIEPGTHPDARPWPHGMVIGTPVTPDRIHVPLPTVVDRLMSALLGPWLAPPS